MSPPDYSIVKTYTLDQAKQFRDFVIADVQKSIDAKTNFLTALGLLCYTEFLGALINDSVGKTANSRKNFETGLYAMGEGYKQFDQHLKSQLKNKGVYKIFRCGMVHSYFIDHNLTIVACDNKSQGLGLGQTKSGELGIATANYFWDFKAAFDKYIQF